MSDIAKAGWLYRRSSVLKRWKKSWVVLYTTGSLRHYENPGTFVAEESYILNTELLAALPASKVSIKLSPPEGLGRTGLFVLKMRTKGDLELCADSADDMSAWLMSIEEARNVQSPSVAVAYNAAPPPYTPSSVPYPGQTIVTPGATTAFVGGPTVVGAAGTTVLGAGGGVTVVQQPVRRVVYPTQTVVYPGVHTVTPQSGVTVVRTGNPRRVGFGMGIYY